MSRLFLRLWATLIIVASVLVSEGAARSAMARVQESATAVLPSRTESATDTVTVHPDGSVETRAEDSRSIGRGSWIRYRKRSDPDHELEGRVEYASEGAIEVVGEKQTVSSNVRFDELETLEVRGPGVGRSGGAQVGVTLGAISGLIIGGVVGNQNEPDCAPDSWFCYEGLATIGGALLGSAIGAVAGGLVGLAVTPDGWIAVPLPSLEVRADGASLAFRVPAR